MQAQGARSTDGARRLRVVELDWGHDVRWAEFLETRRDALVFHHPGWLGSLEREYGRPPIGLACVEGGEHVEDGERVLGVLPLLETRGLPLPGLRAVAGPRLSSLPRTPLAGPCAVDATAERALLAAAVQRVRLRPGLQLQLKPGRPGLSDWAPALTRVPWRWTYVVELPGPEGTVRFGSSRNHGRIRWAVQKARRDGVRVREAETLADVHAWYELYLRTMRRNLVPPRPWRLVLAMWELLRPVGHMRLLLAERMRGGTAELLAGSVLLAFGRTVHYAFNGVRPDAIGLRPNDLIQWQAIHDARDAGYDSYDLGEVSEGDTGLAQFKRKWGGQPVRLHRYYYPPPTGSDSRKGLGMPASDAALRAAGAAWRRVPLRVTAAAGDVVYGFL
jgi:hypothetical protein